MRQQMPPHTARQGDARTPLSDYVRDYLERTKVSKNQFSLRCVDPEDPQRVIYIQWLDRLLNGSGPAPELWRLRALAAGMGANLEDLKRMAAIQWLDYDVAEIRDSDGVVMIPVRRPVSEAELQQITRVTRAILGEDEESS